MILKLTMIGTNARHCPDLETLARVEEPVYAGRSFYDLCRSESGNGQYERRLVMADADPEEFTMPWIEEIYGKDIRWKKVASNFDGTGSEYVIDSDKCVVLWGMYIPDADDLMDDVDLMGSMVADQGSMVTLPAEYQGRPIKWTSVRTLATVAEDESDHSDIVPGNRFKIDDCCCFYAEYADGGH